MALSTHPKVWQTLAWITAGITAAFLVCFYFMELFLTFVIGFSLLVITRKLVSDFQASAARYKLRPWQRKLIGYGLVFFWIFSIVFLMHSSLDQISRVIQQADRQDDSLRAIYDERVVPYLPGWLSAKVLTSERVGRLETEAVKWITDSFTAMARLFMYGVLLVPLMFYLRFYCRENYAGRIADLVPERIRARYAHITREIGENVHEYFRARVIESVAVGSLCCLGFYIGGVKGWLILGLLAGALNIADFIGPTISLVPPVAVSLLANDPIAATFAVATIIVAQIVDNFVLVPFMISSKVKINPLLTITLILVGAHVLGIIGIVLAIPVYLIYKIILTEAYAELVAMYDPKAVKT